jgi:hypothetical protein
VAGGDLLFVVTDSKLQVTRHDTLFLVITSGIAGQLEDLSGKVLEYGSKVDCSMHISIAPDEESRLHTRCTSTDALGVVTLLQETVDTTNWELKTSLSRTRLLSFAFASGRGLSRLRLSSSLARHSRCLYSSYEGRRNGRGGGGGCWSRAGPG